MAGAGRLRVSVLVIAVLAGGTALVVAFHHHSPAHEPAASNSSPALAGVHSDLRAALAATTWPVLSPDFTHPAAKDNRGCAWDTVPPISQCTWGNPAAAHTFYLVGDSTSAAYLPAFAAFIDAIPTWKMVVRSDSGCPFSTTPAPEGQGLDPAAGSQACTTHDETVVAEIKSVRPDMVVFTSVSGAIPRVPGKQAELERIAPYVGRIVVFPTSPPLKDPKQCDTASGTPAACVTVVPAPYAVWLRNFAAVARAVHGVFIDPTELFCADGRCPVFVHTIPKTDDGVHMTVNYAEYLAPAIHELFQRDKLLP